MRSAPIFTRNDYVRAGFFLLLFMLVLPAGGFADVEADAGRNRIVSVACDKDGVQISTEAAVGDQYTVYDSVDPLRIIVDFSDMGVAGLEPEIQVSDGAVEIVKTSSFDLSSGQLGRVEIILNQPVKYNVVTVDKGLRLDFEKEPESADGAPASASADAVAVAAKAEASPAEVLGSVQVVEGSAVFYADGDIGKYKYFTLTKPERLVVDVYDVVAGFKERAFDLNGGFEKMRVGVYPGKVRLVLDAIGAQLPQFGVSKEGNTLAVTWSAGADDKVASPVEVVAPATQVPADPPGVAEPVSITDIDFTVNKEKSILSIKLSGAAEIEPPATQGNIIQFGIRNVAISRQHRRTIDPSVFPSSVRLITPYTVHKNGVDEVRFAVEMKSMQAYTLNRVGQTVQLVIDNGPYAEPLPTGVAHKIVPGQPVASAPSVAARPAKENMESVVDQPSGAALQMDSDTITIKRKKEFVGEKISLVFDDADIRNILQLIGEVSGLNIIVADDVKGTMTLRLIDVPWDQALDLVLEIRELGKLQDGNILRILPLAKIRQMQQQQYEAERAKEKLEDLVTDLIPVSYTDIEGLVEACEKRLSDRGKVIGDVRDKKIIITDIPTVVADIKQLVSMLDTPVRQVLIEARIVEASATFSRDLGVNWGLTYSNDPAVDGNDASISGGGTLIGVPVSAGEVTGGLVSGLTFGKVGVDKTVLDLRLAALEESGHGRIVSTPRVSTLNGQEAEVAQGTEIPYLSVSDEGTKTEFKKAELSLKVTPEINPDGSVILEIEAKNDSRGANTGTAEAPAIDTKRATTKVLVKDGETTVIGGIFIQDKSESTSGVPWLMNVPILGHFFKSTSVSEERRELLVFITPRILN